MKRLFFNLFLSLAAFFSVCQQVAAQWSWAVKSNGPGYELAFDIDRDANGNNYIVGDYSTAAATFGGTILPISGTTGACFLAKTNPNGAFLWALRMGGNAAFYPHAEAVTTNGTDVFVTGRFRGTLELYSTTSAGPISLVGTNTSQDDCFIAKYDANGVIQWASKYGGAGHQQPMDIAINAFTQQVLVTGSNVNNIFVLKYNYATGALVSQGLSLNSTAAVGMGIVADPAGNSYLLAKYTSGTILLPGSSVSSTGSNNMLLAKYNPAGATVWVQNIGGTGGEFPTRGGAIDIDGSNNVYIAGDYTQTANISSIPLPNNSTTTRDLFIAKYNNAGQIQWAKKAGGVNNENARGIATDNAGNVFITAISQANNSVAIDCQTFPSIFGNADNKFFVVKYDNAGNVKWAVAPTVNNDQTQTFGITTNGDGYAVVAGLVVGTGIFGPTTLTASGATLSDVLVTKVRKDLSDFTLSASFPSGSSNFYQITATPTVTPPGFWWEVSEIDVITGAVVPGTTMTNPSNWWVAPFITSNTFPGYCCNAAATTGYGLFAIGHKYRITRGTWGACNPWDATSKTVYMSFAARGTGEKSLQVEDNPSYSPHVELSERTAANAVDKSPELVSTSTFRCFPNPVTDHATFEYSLAIATVVDLKILDMTGKILSQFALGEQSEGIYQFDWKTGNLPKGMYFGRLEAGAKIQTLKIVVN